MYTWILTGPNTVGVLVGISIGDGWVVGVRVGWGFSSRSAVREGVNCSWVIMRVKEGTGVRVCVGTEEGVAVGETVGGRAVKVEIGADVGETVDVGCGVVALQATRSKDVNPKKSRQAILRPMHLKE